MLDDLVLKKLASGPKYAMSFKSVKPVVDRLVKSGRVVRIAPPGQRYKSMIALAEHHRLSQSLAD